jgi:hypothetical protein
MSATEHHIDPLTAVRQLVFQKNFHFAESGVDKVPEENRQTLLPRDHFAEPRAGTEYVAGLFAEPDVQMTGIRFDEKRGCCSAGESHFVPQ